MTDIIIHDYRDKNVTREICGSFPGGYAFCQVLETYGDERRMLVSYGKNGNVREFYARHGLGHVLETSVRDSEAFKRGDPIY